MEESFNDKFARRTKEFAVEAVLFYAKYCKSVDEMKIIGKQFLRCSTSVAANFRAFTRGRSTAEKYSKLCIVVEETDESLFWLELLQETKLIDNEKLDYLKKESEELLKVFSVSRKNFKS